MTMTDAMNEAIWFQGLLNDLGIDQDLLKINCDTVSAIIWQKTRFIMQERSTSMSCSTLFGRFLVKMTSS